jgi:hypothetical protein
MFVFCLVSLPGEQWPRRPKTDQAFAASICEQHLECPAKTGSSAGLVNGHGSHERPVLSTSCVAFDAASPELPPAPSTKTLSFAAIARPAKRTPKQKTHLARPGKLRPEIAEGVALVEDLASLIRRKGNSTWKDWQANARDSEHQIRRTLGARPSGCATQVGRSLQQRARRRAWQSAEDSRTSHVPSPPAGSPEGACAP